MQLSEALALYTIASVSEPAALAQDGQTFIFVMITVKPRRIDTEDTASGAGDSQDTGGTAAGAGSTAAHLPQSVGAKPIGLVRNKVILPGWADEGQPFVQLPHLGLDLVLALKWLEYHK